MMMGKCCDALYHDIVPLPPNLSPRFKPMESDGPHTRDYSRSFRKPFWSELNAPFCVPLVYDSSGPMVPLLTLRLSQVLKSILSL